MMKGSEYERVFVYFDENRDGKVSPLELKNRMRSMGMMMMMGSEDIEEMEASIESLDKDGDGMLDFEELVGLIEGGSSSEEEKLKDLREAFGLYDVGNCGFIKPSDLKRMLDKLGESKSTDECKMMINRFDLNGDGVLSFEEFRDMMQ